MSLLPWKNKIFIGCLSLAVAVCVNQCFNIQAGDLIYSNSIFSVILLVGYAYGLCKLVQEEKRYLEIRPFLNISFIFLLGFTGALISGVQLDNNGRVDFGNLGYYVVIVLLALGWTPYLAWLIYKLKSMEERRFKDRLNETTVNELSEGRYFLKITCILMLTYIPVLLAAWPGFFTYDAEVETYMVFTDKYSAHHPIAHVALLGWIMKLMYKIIPSYNIGIAAYLLLQMMIVSCCFAYMLCFLKKIGVRKWIINIGLVYLALFPTVSMFVCCTTKDVYFSAGLVLFTTLLLEMARDVEGFWQSGKKRWLFFASTLLIILFRNNGIYAYIVFLPFFAWMYRSFWKKWLWIMIGIFGFVLIFNYGMTEIFHVKPGEKAEMLCVPMQQLARVHSEMKECFIEDDLEIMYSLIPEEILENYNPKLADNIKVNFLEDNFKADPGKYISLWIRIGLKCPDIYINSMLMNTYGYWYPDTVIDGYEGKWNVDRSYGESSYFAFTTEMPGIRMSLLPFLERFYEKISLEIYQQKIPVLSMLFSMGFWHWVYLFAATYLCAIKYKKQAFAFLLIGFVYLTVLLGPIAIVRYVLYMFFAAPLVFALLFDTTVFKGRYLK